MERSWEIGRAVISGSGCKRFVGGQIAAAADSVGRLRWQEIPGWFLWGCGAALLLLLAGFTVLAVWYRRIRAHEWKNSMTDPLTGMGNKAWLIRSCEEKRKEGQLSSCALFYIGFPIEQVNNYYGEAEAEEMLRYAAGVLAQSISGADAAARVAGGAFAVVRSGKAKEARRWAEEILPVLNRYSDRFGQDYRPAFHIGIYLVEKTDEEADAIWRSARQGYLQAVQENVGYRFSYAGFWKEEKEKRQLRRQVPEALQGEEFALYLQYVVDAQTGEAVGAEALSRWEHPQKGLLPPERYIQMLETEGMVAQLDFYMFDKVCRQLEQWGQQGKDLSLSCNFTRITIDQEDFISRLKEIAGRYRFDYSRLVIEITEEIMENNKKAALENISQCRELGFRISLDDAGSGYTFFSDLKDYPIDILKIDRSILVQAVDEKGIALLRGMIELGHTLHMKVICEGIETEEQIELLRGLDCDYLQGFYFYEPAPAGEADRP